MRRRPHLVALTATAAILFVLVPTSATAQTHEVHATCSGKPPRYHVLRDFTIAGNAFEHEHWRDGTPWTAAQKSAWLRHKRCLLARTKRNKVEAQKNDKLRSWDAWRDRMRARYEFRRQYTPFNCGNGWWAIPCSIISCESGFSWSASNPSGAIGPYQLLGWGAPWPVNSLADKRAHHIIAARVWNGGAGRDNWVC